MPHFKDQENCLYFLTDDEVASGWLDNLPPGLVQITDDEAEQLRNAHLSAMIVPRFVTRRQALLALLAADLLDDVEAIIAAAPRAVQIAWDASSVFERNNPLIASMAEQLELSDEDVDALFVQASTL